MKTIVFAATKGGTGKSTLAFNVGVEAAKHGSVYWADLDPQKSLTQMAEWRSSQPDFLGNQPMLLDDVGNVVTAVQDIERTKYTRDFLIVDTPGSHIPIIRNAIQAADVVVLPCQPSPLDILAQEDAAPLIDELGKGSRTLFAINKVDGRAGIDDVMQRIEAMFPNVAVRINQRQAYMRSPIRGMSGPEFKPKECGPEIERLWAAITAIMEK